MALQRLGFCVLVTLWMAAMNGVAAQMQSEGIEDLTVELRLTKVQITQLNALWVDKMKPVQPALVMQDSPIPAWRSSEASSRFRPISEGMVPDAIGLLNEEQKAKLTEMSKVIDDSRAVGYAVWLHLVRQYWYGIESSRGTSGQDRLSSPERSAERFEVLNILGPGQQ